MDIIKKEKTVFTQPQPMSQSSSLHVEPMQTRKGKSGSNSFLLVVLILIFLVQTALAGFYVNKSRMEGKAAPIDPSRYYVVFLTNGQVYFGNIESITPEQLILKNVYFLESGQANSLQTEDVTSQYRLVKTVDQIYAPTDRVYINFSQVLSYQELDTASKVVESLEKAKNR